MGEKAETNTYDGLNQLIGFTDSETVASYAYNVDGLRIEKTVDDETIHHVWNGSQQIIADVVDGQFYEANCYLRGTNLVATYNYQNIAELIDDKVPDSCENALDTVPALLPVARKQANKYIKNA